MVDIVEEITGLLQPNIGSNVGVEVLGVEGVVQTDVADELLVGAIGAKAILSILSKNMWVVVAVVMAGREAKDKKMPKLKTEARSQAPAGERNRGRPRKIMDGTSDKKLRVMEVSVTVSVGGADIDYQLLGEIGEFLKKETIAGICSLERGGSAFNLHFQMVVRLWSSSLVSVNKKIKGYLGWDKQNAQGGIVLCRALKQRNLHTFRGMVGYCYKDHDQPHFRCVTHNITAEDINEGLELYALYGADAIKNKICLTPANIFDRVLMFWTYKLQHPLGTNFLDTLHRMIKCGKFYPSSAWITPYQGRGMEPEKIEALWKCLAFPSTTTKGDICSIFVLHDAYRNAQPRADWFTSRWKETHHVDNAESPAQTNQETDALGNDSSWGDIGDEFLPLVHSTGMEDESDHAHVEETQSEETAEDADPLVPHLHALHDNASNHPRTLRSVRLLRDVWGAMCKGMSTRLQARLYDGMRDYLNGVALQAHYGGNGSIPTVDEYKSVRRACSLVGVCFILLEYAHGIELDEETLQNERIQQLFDVGVDHVSFTNDIMSCRVELFRGDQFNLPAIIYLNNFMKGKVDNTSTSARTESLMQDATRTLNEVDELCARLTEELFKSELVKKKGIEAYVKGIGAWIAGNKIWSLKTARYTHICSPPPPGTRLGSCCGVTRASKWVLVLLL
ncbi:hypothetical protein L7F22_024043 [Adiantum nelumboides]|nr:hypothetical protein [Adiantum nelumboides]